MCEKHEDDIDIDSAKKTVGFSMENFHFSHDLCESTTIIRRDGRQGYRVSSAPDDDYVKASTEVFFLSWQRDKKVSKISAIKISVFFGFARALSIFLSHFGKSFILLTATVKLSSHSRLTAWLLISGKECFPYFFESALNRLRCAHRLHRHFPRRMINLLQTMLFPSRHKLHTKFT